MNTKIYLTKGKNCFGTIRYQLVYKQQAWFSRLSRMNSFDQYQLDWYANGQNANAVNDFEYVYTDVPYGAQPKDMQDEAVPPK